MPDELIDLAHRYSRSLERRGWGDGDELLSAALQGVLDCLAHIEQTGMTPEDLRSYAAAFVRFRCMRARTQSGRRHRRLPTYAVDTNELGHVLFVDHRSNPGLRAEVADFWQLVGRVLSNDDATIVSLRFRDGLSLRETGERVGLGFNRIAYRLEVAMRQLRENLPGYRPNERGTSDRCSEADRRRRVPR